MTYNPATAFFRDEDTTPAIAFYNPHNPGSMLLYLPPAVTLFIGCPCCDVDVYALDPAGEHAWGATFSATEFLYCWRLLFCGLPGSD